MASAQVLHRSPQLLAVLPVVALEDSQIVEQRVLVRTRLPPELEHQSQMRRLQPREKRERLVSHREILVDQRGVSRRRPFLHQTSIAGVDIRPLGDDPELEGVPQMGLAYPVASRGVLQKLAL